MPNIKSAKKRVKVSKAKTLRNKTVKSNLKTVLKKADVAISTSANDKEAAAVLAVKKLDQAAAKGIMHKNTVARRKSQIAKKLNAAQ